MPYLCTNSVCILNYEHLSDVWETLHCYLKKVVDELHVTDTCCSIRLYKRRHILGVLPTPMSSRHTPSMQVRFRVLLRKWLDAFTTGYERRARLTAITSRTNQSRFGGGLGDGTTGARKIRIAATEPMKCGRSATMMTPLQNSLAIYLGNTSLGPSHWSIGVLFPLPGLHFLPR